MSNYRLFSLSAEFSEICARVTCKRVTHHLNSSGTLVNELFGFI